MTNSSSTSFVVIVKKEFTEESFLRAAGVEEGSPMTPLFRRFYKIITQNVQEEIDKKLLRSDSIRRNGISSAVIHKINESLDAGYMVLRGELSSDQEAAEVFLCLDSVEIDDEKFYFNAEDCCW